MYKCLEIHLTFITQKGELVLFIYTSYKTFQITLLQEDFILERNDIYFPLQTPTEGKTKIAKKARGSRGIRKRSGENIAGDRMPLNILFSFYRGEVLENASFLFRRLQSHKFFILYSDP